MKALPIQQRRLFFLTTATSNTKTLKAVGPLWNERFRLSGWIAVILSAALLIGCSSLTPDRVNVIAAIAGQAAQAGAADWLAKHPNHKASFDAVIAALVALQKAGNTNEDAAVELLSSLPTDALKGPDGELYVAGDGGLVVWDGKLKKSVTVRGPATVPVIRATLLGLRRATGPKPPLPPSRSALALPPDVVMKELEGARPKTLVYRGVTNVVYEIRGTNVARNPTVTNLNLNVHSTFDVTLNEYGVQQVNVRWNMDPNASYTVQRMEENKAWEGFASATNTNAVPTTCLWRTLWHHQCPVGNWRVVRR